MFLSACQAAISSSTVTSLEGSWVYTDLRAYDPADASSPGADLVAISARYAGTTFQLRLDWLDLAIQPDIDIYLALDTGNGGSAALPIRAHSSVEWENLIVIPASHAIEVLDGGLMPQLGLSVIVARDPLQDKIDIQMRGASLPARYPGIRLQMFVTRPGSPELVDASPVIDSNQPSPPAVNVLFAFWNTFPAYTPAQALRRWDGAHTGPFGGRHGLYNLLRAFRNRGLPVALLDLKWPASLSALDYAGGLPMVRDMARNGLLILPDVLPAVVTNVQGTEPDWFQERVAAESRQAAQLFNLPTSQYLTAPLADGLPANYAFVFTPQPGLPPLKPVSILRHGGQRLLPIPAYGAVIQAPAQATPDGPSLELRRALAEAATLPEAQEKATPDHLLLLGGELPSSAWGEPTSAGTTLDYLIHKPWIRLLGENDLLGTQPSASAGASRTAQPDPLLEAFRNSLQSTLSEAAWQTYLALQAPVYPTSLELPALRKAYASQVNILIDAAEWETGCQPEACTQPIVRCVETQLCTLADAQGFAAVDLRTGGLLFLFLRSENGEVHQLIGPTSQLIVGQSNPASWQLDHGLLADPAVIPGGFADESGPYQIISDSEKLTLVSSDGQLRKSYSLSGHGFLVKFDSPQPFVVRIPIVFDPWRRITPGWGRLYQGEARGDGWQWGITPGPQMVVHTNGQLTAQEFTASQSKMGGVEDPNYDFPPGHYLDFPLALLEIYAGDHLTVEFQFSP